MLDRMLYKFFGAIDNLFERINNFLFAPRCKCKKKKKDAQACKKMVSAFKNVVCRYKRTPR